MTELTIQPASRVPWAAVEDVLGSTAESRHCWCRWWVTTNADYSALDDGDRRAATQSDHETGQLRGLVALRDGEPVGWVGVGPRADFVRLPRTKVIAGAVPEADFDVPGIWSVLCFTVSPAHRRTGVARALLTAAVEHARAAGATTVEAYPIDTGTSAGSALPPTDLNTGTAALFASAGFREVGTRVKSSRPIMQFSVVG